MAMVNLVSPESASRRGMTSVPSSAAASGRGAIDALRAAYRVMREDVEAAMGRDPAAHSRLEMFLASSGLHAIWAYRCLLYTSRCV